MRENVSARERESESGESLLLISSVQGVPKSDQCRFFNPFFLSLELIPASIYRFICSYSFLLLDYLIVLHGITAISVKSARRIPFRTQVLAVLTVFSVIFAIRPVLKKLHVCFST